ncbi:MAG: ImuA family protein [Caulobacteraceae bacterium]
MSPSSRSKLDALRAKIAVMERGGRGPADVLALGDPRLDGRFLGGGLPLGCWHEFAGEGLERETGAAGAGFVARLAAPLARRGEVVWVLRRGDLHAPGLAGLGLPAERLIQVCAPSEAEVLAVLEDALRTPGVAAAVGEAESVGLTAGRRLQLACEEGAATGFVLRRRPFANTAKTEAAGSAAATRWTVAPAPSEPAPGEPGLGEQRWRARLERCRGGRTGAWILEASEDDDDAHPFRLVAELGDRDVAAAATVRLAG